jgi:ankyrin repeat protein
MPSHLTNKCCNSNKRFKKCKKKSNKKEKKKTIDILKSNPPPPGLLKDWLMQGDIKALAAVKKLGWSHLINEPFKWHPDPNHPPSTLFLLLCCHDGLPVCSIEWMIENGADLRVKDEYGATAMHYAVAGKCPETVCALWRTEEKEWFLNEPNNDGKTPMQMIEEDMA